MNASITTATIASGNRFSAIIARQRSGRVRDLLFAAVLAVGVALSLGALRNAAAHAAAPIAAAPVIVVAAG